MRRPSRRSAARAATGVEGRPRTRSGTGAGHQFGRGAGGRQARLRRKEAQRAARRRHRASVGWFPGVAEAAAAIEGILLDDVTFLGRVETGVTAPALAPDGRRLVMSAGPTGPCRHQPWSPSWSSFGWAPPAAWRWGNGSRRAPRGARRVPMGDGALGRAGVKRREYSMEATPEGMLGVRTRRQWAARCNLTRRARGVEGTGERLSGTTWTLRGSGGEGGCPSALAG